MALYDSYAVWNNKGRVGKSTLTFHLATRFAELNPDFGVLVVDMDPQADVSKMLLGGTDKGGERVVEYNLRPEPRSVVGYVSNVLDAGANAVLPDPFDFITRPRDWNVNISENVYLMCGDWNLETIAPALYMLAEQPQLTWADPWRWVHLTIRNMIGELICRDSLKSWAVFIDTASNFMSYTALAICGADHLIVPICADEVSRAGTCGVIDLMYGRTPKHPFYGDRTFAATARAKSLQLPPIHLVVGNRVTADLQDLDMGTKATIESLFTVRQYWPRRFAPRASKPLAVQQFRDDYFMSLPDLGAAGVVATHTGHPLSALQDGTYSVHGTQIQISQDVIRAGLTEIDKITKRL